MKHRFFFTLTKSHSQAKWEKKKSGSLQQYTLQTQRLGNVCFYCYSINNVDNLTVYWQFAYAKHGSVFVWFWFFFFVKCMKPTIQCWVSGWSELLNDRIDKTYRDINRTDIEVSACERACVCVCVLNGHFQSVIAPLSLNSYIQIHTQTHTRDLLNEWIEWSIKPTAIHKYHIFKTTAKKSGRVFFVQSHNFVSFNSKNKTEIRIFVLLSSEKIIIKIK